MDLCSVVGVLVTFVVFLCAWYIWTRRKFYMLSVSLPGPFALPFVGNGLSVLCKSEELLSRILALTEPYSSPMRLWLGPQLVVVVHDPDQLQTIMLSSKMTTKSFVYRYLEPFMGQGLFTCSGALHKSQRKLLQPLFGPKLLEGYSYLFQKHANIFVDRLKPYINGDKFDVLLLLHDAAFESTMDILIDDKNDHSIDLKYFPEYVRRFYHIFVQRILSFWLYPDFIYKLTGYYKEQQEMSKMCRILTEEVKDTRIPEIVNKLGKSRCNENCETRIPSMLETMVEMVYEQPDILTIKEFQDNMLTFVATSQDTQSSAIAFTLMMLGMHQEIQAKVVEELKEVLGDKKHIDFNDTGKLKYMEMCLKESLRLFPLAPFLPRDVIEDSRLGIKMKWSIPTGCTVILGVYQVHKNPELWEKPEEFYPEHFFGRSFTETQQYSYTNMKIMMSSILQNYAIECPGTLKDLKLMTDVSIRPIDGYMIIHKKRTL
ncbi:hypothetical protein NQ317_019382 [Molorchus minor]|uniref:Cytochrome P450 n=1 Tax=Molorchus minor TaxID=1323400 RepID=A0ABQ9JFE0_9CUCU|nr:hypothetical protein NQ317_019382 [Molorchus minor]